MSPAVDIDAALATIGNPAARRAASLALLDAVAEDPDGIARIASAIAPADRLNFTFDAIASRAAEDPEKAIASVIALSDIPARTEALVRVARELARRDPLDALAQARSIDTDALADAYRSAVFEELASVDPGAFLAMLENARSEVTVLAYAAFGIVAETEPQRLLGVLARIPAGARFAAERAALGGLVRLDPAAALEHLQELPSGQSRDRLFQVTAKAFATHDPDRALAWANTMQPPSPAATVGVLQALAETQPVRGAEILIDKLRVGAIDAQRDLETIMSSFTPGDRADLAVVASRLAAVDDSSVRPALDSLIDYWSQNDADAAHDWALAHIDQLQPSALVRLARNLVAGRPDLAKESTARIPPNLQGTWIAEVATGLARTGVDDALEWVSRFEGQPGFDGALQAALQTLSWEYRITNPQSVAGFLDRQSPEIRAEVIARVANSWAGADPAAAAQWVERASLRASDEGRRSAALSNIARRWAEPTTRSRVSARRGLQASGGLRWCRCRPVACQ
jgi:hypothetical protein